MGVTASARTGRPVRGESSAPGPVLSPQIDRGARLALKGPTVAFLNLLPLLSEFPWPHPLPSDLHLNKHVKKKTAIDNKGLSVLFCFVFLSEDGLFTEIKSPQGAPQVDVYTFPPHFPDSPCSLPQRRQTTPERPTGG